MWSHDEQLPIAACPHGGPHGGVGRQVEIVLAVADDVAAAGLRDDGAPLGQQHVGLPFRCAAFERQRADRQRSAVTLDHERAERFFVHKCAGARRAGEGFNERISTRVLRRWQRSAMVSFASCGKVAEVRLSALPWLTSHSRQPLLCVLRPMQI